MIYKSVGTNTLSTTDTSSSWGSVKSVTIATGIVSDYVYDDTNKKLYKKVGFVGTVYYYKDITNQLKNGDILVLATGAKVVTRTLGLSIS